jgi:hypothetical protein
MRSYENAIGSYLLGERHGNESNISLPSTVVFHRKGLASMTMRFFNWLPAYDKGQRCPNWFLRYRKQRAAAQELLGTAVRKVESAKRDEELAKRNVDEAMHDLGAVEGNALLVIPLTKGTS